MISGFQVQQYHYYVFNISWRLYYIDFIIITILLKSLNWKIANMLTHSVEYDIEFLRLVNDMTRLYFMAK